MTDYYNFVIIIIPALMKEDDPFKTTEFNDEKKLISFLRRQNAEIDFFNCAFNIQGDIGNQLIEAELSGLESIIPDQQNQGSIGWITSGFFISNVRFTKPVTFNQCKFLGPLYFRNVHFEKGCTFIDSDCDNNVDFTYVKFLGTSQFRSIRAKQHVSFIKCVIHSTEIGFRASQYESGVSFFDTTINGELDLGNSNIKDILLIRLCTINGKLNVSDAAIDRFQLIGNDKNNEPMLLSKVSLKDSTFKGQVQIHRIKVSEMFTADWAQFSESVFVGRSHFCGNCLWTSAIFEKSVSIDKTVFEISLNFANAKFDGRVTIWRTDYQNSQIYFSGAKFKDSLSLGASLTHHKKSQFKGLMSFESAVFESGTIIRIFGVNTVNRPGGEFNFKNALVKGLIDIREVYLNTISFDGSVVTGNIQDNGSILSAIKDVGSARLLKHESRKINNHLAALRYYRTEMDWYSKTLKWYKGDWWLLWLNRISNDFGLSWTRGMLFTVVSGFCCYTFFRFQISGYDISLLLREKFWAGFINFFWLPTGFNELVNSTLPVHLNGGVFGAFGFILGKIAIAYGIYQTIAAFRKHMQ